MYRKILRWILKSNLNFLLNQFYFNELKENHSKLTYKLKKKIDNLMCVFFEKIDIQTPEIFQEMRTFLKRLNQRKIKIFASTNSSVIKTEEKMKQTDILKFFELVLGRESSKINHVSLFAKHLNMDLKEFCDKTIYVGDEPIDILLAKKNKIYSIGVTNTIGNELLKKFGPDKIVKNIIKAC